MKYFFLLLALAALSLADEDGCISSVVPAVPQTGGTDAVTLNLLNDWVLTEKALGLDVFISGSGDYVLGVDNNLDIVQAYEPATGTPVGFLTLDAANAFCFGVAWNNDPIDETYYTDDWAVGNLFFTDDFGSTWSTSSNPAGTMGRGMDFDGLDYWMTSTTTGSVWRFQPGVGQDNIPVPDVSGNLSGITVYPEGSDIGVIVAGYNDTFLHFYVWDGSTLDYVGAAAYPVPALGSSYGLAYYETNGTLFWSYKDTSDNYHLAELEFDTTALQQSTWGNIKSSF